MQTDSLHDHSFLIKPKRNSHFALILMIGESWTALSELFLVELFLYLLTLKENQVNK